VSEGLQGAVEERMSDSRVVVDEQAAQAVARPAQRGGRRAPLMRLRARAAFMPAAR
jgi:hypothetical protein